LRTWVAEVTVATANGALIQRYKGFAGTFQRIRAARATVKKFSAGSPYSDPRKLAEAEATLKGLESKMEEINHLYRQTWKPDCVGAFVVFNCEEVRVPGDICVG
jgi:hypothetical protein